MSDDITEVGGFEPRRYMGMFLTVQFKEKPALAEWRFIEKVGIYDKYESEIPFYYYLVDEENQHYYLAREELYNDAEMYPS
jgi:hypothetical protein